MEKIVSIEASKLTNLVAYGVVDLSLSSDLNDDEYS